MHHRCKYAGSVPKKKQEAHKKWRGMETIYKQSVQSGDVCKSHGISGFFFPPTESIDFSVKNLKLNIFVGKPKMLIHKRHHSIYLLGVLGQVPHAHLLLDGLGSLVGLHFPWCTKVSSLAKPPWYIMEAPTMVHHGRCGPAGESGPYRAMGAWWSQKTPMSTMVVFLIQIAFGFGEKKCVFPMKSWLFSTESRHFLQKKIFFNWILSILHRKNSFDENIHPALVKIFPDHYCF